MKNTVATFAQAKAEGRKLAMLTAYDYSTAKLEDEAGIDGILIGDSLGNVVLGYEDTLSVTVEDMIHHSAAVARGAKNALIVCDMPFLSYEVSVPDAVRNAGRLLKEGRANCVKLEGGEEVCPQVAAMVAAGIPVMGHLGLTPQSINAFGGFKVQGKSEAAARKLISDAKALEAAGAFAIVLEAVPAKLAALVTKEVGVPTIGIGAGAGCDGQILVYQDMLGMFSDFCPKFVKRFANVGEAMRDGFASYINEVRRLLPLRRAHVQDRRRSAREAVLAITGGRGAAEMPRRARLPKRFADTLHPAARRTPTRPDAPRVVQGPNTTNRASRRPDALHPRHLGSRRLTIYRTRKETY